MKKSLLFLLCINFSCNNITSDNIRHESNIYFYSENNKKYQIYKYDTNKKEKINITDNSDNVYSYTINHAKDKIAYISSQDNKNFLYIMDSEGKNKKKLTDKINCHNPVISPDGKKVAFVSDKKIFTVNYDGTSLKELNKTLVEQLSPNWSSDSKKITFESNKTIYSINYDGNQLKKISNSNFSKENENLSFTDPLQNINVNTNKDYTPVWSPDGKKIAFVSNRKSKWNIYIINEDGTNEIKVSEGSEDIMPSWSPDSEKIAFVSKKIKSDGTSVNQINIINKDGTGFKTINESSQNSEPVWSKDGNFIVFSSSKTGNSDIFISNIRTLETVNITNSPEADFSPRL